MKNLAKSGNIDGWGIAYIPKYGDSAITKRSAISAFHDADYDELVNTLETVKPKITIAHIRYCTSGCCAHGKEIVKNPHPFYRDKDGKRWIFAHNGGVSVKRMKKLIGEEYLQANPPNGSDISACAGNIVDSELYFLHILKNIEENNGDIIKGIIAAIVEIVKDGEHGGMNFILSDGKTMWAFRKGGLILHHKLYYLHDSEKGYSAVATQYPSSSQDNWIAMDNYELVVLRGNSAPVVVQDDRLNGLCFISAAITH
ncbi:MAG: class II glutamine amidotransferase [Deltaproteobacteria bacterium]|nr:class II glutamine amidotransferase [Deltaproteobacteria bacterium]